MNIAIIGYGYWGPNILRNFQNVKKCKVSYVHDLDSDKLKPIKNLYPQINITQNYDKILDDKDVDAVVIATPVSTHYHLAKKALKKGKHVLVEKPMTKSVKHANDLICLAKRKKLVLMVDHTYLYTDAIKKIKDIISKGLIGKIQYLDSTRINLGLFQSDVNVLWDLAAHDISICLHLFNEKPIAVQAIGKSHANTDLEDIAYLTLHYDSNKIAHFNCSWISPVKIRHMLIGGDKKMIIFNDLESTEKIKVYDTGYKNKINSSDSKKFLADYRIGDIYIPKVAMKEGLFEMAKDFRNAVIKGKKPISNFQLGLEVVRILEAGEKSIKNNGKIVKL